MHDTPSNTALSRRGFLKAAALSGAGLAGATTLGGCAPATSSSNSSATSGDDLAATGEPSFLTAPASIDADEIAETVDTDVLVIGSGIAGAITASSCTEQGLKVFLVEKAEAPRNIGLDYGFVNPGIMAEKNIEPVDVYEVVRDHMEKSCHRCRGDKVYRFMSESGAAGDWYLEKARGYGFVPEVIAMKSNSDHFKNYVHVVELWPDEGAVADDGDWYAATKAMIANLQQEVVSGGGEYRNLTEAVQLLVDGGRVTGAICKGENGYLQVNAAKGVVLACGDYAADPEMLDYYTAWDFDSFDPDFFINESTGTGDGHKMGLWAGAAMQPGPHPLMTFMAYAYSYLRVNNLGQRYVNEDAGYTGGGNAQLIQPAAASWAIWDDKWREELPNQMPYAGGMSWDQDGRRIQDPWTPEGEEELAFSWEIEDGLLVQANSLEELANVMGLAPEAIETFLATVKRYNELVDAGDTDFGKRPELMAKIEQPPFYGLRMNVELGASVSGLITNADSECLTEAGAVIPGLYAVGNNAGGLFGIDYNEVTIPGISLGRCVTFGWLLGQHLAK